MSVPNSMIYVEDLDGTKHEVQLSGDGGRCSCKSYRALRHCSHITYAMNVHSGRCAKYYLFTVASAFHKEIRRSDQKRGLAFAEAYSRVTSPTTVANYVSKIVFEETRNLDLFGKIQSGLLHHSEIAHYLIRSRKKWELDFYANHMRDWTDAYANYYRCKDKWINSPWDMISETVARGSTPVELYPVTFFLRHNKEFNDFFWIKISERAEKERNEKLKEYLALNPESRYYHILIALDLALNHWNKQADEYAEEERVKVDLLPSFRDYVFDLHTFRGRKRLLAHWNLIAPGRDHAAVGLDLRWSGSLVGCIFRSEAYKQYGFLTDRSGADIPWTGVSMEQSLWQKTLHLDKFFYPDFFDEIERR